MAMELRAAAIDKRAEHHQCHAPDRHVRMRIRRRRPVNATRAVEHLVAQIRRRIDQQAV
jgi:hypothetical protein